MYSIVSFISDEALENFPTSGHSDSEDDYDQFAQPYEPLSPLPSDEEEEELEAMSPVVDEEDEEELQPLSPVVDEEEENVETSGSFSATLGDLSPVAIIIDSEPANASEDFIDTGSLVVVEEENEEEPRCPGAPMKKRRMFNFSINQSLVRALFLNDAD
jgi:hypothetical protein